jgi:lipopolysaccharide transport system ATP-binding protein
MTRPSIVVEELGKIYRIGARGHTYRTFRDALVHLVASPFRRLRGGGPSQAATEIFWALKGISFDVQPGEVVGIIGRNGAGKSTLLKVLSRITEPTEGSVRIRGRVASLLEVGTGFHPELTGRENIYLNGSIMGMRKVEIDRKFDAMVAFAGIERFLDTPVKYYSSGMYVRLAFAVAAHLEPQILIVDEVLAVGDAAFQKRCLGRIKEVTEEGRTVLFVSHNLTVVRSLCSRVVWLEDGRIKMDGDVAPVIECYLAGMLGDSQARYDLDRYERQAGGSHQLKLKHLAFNGGNPVRHGEPLEFEIGYETLADLEEVAFGIGFCTAEGGRVMSVDTDIPGPRFTLREGARGVVEFRIETLHLQPGRYFLDVGARSGEHVGLDLLLGFAQVEVLPGMDTPAVLVGHNAAGGVRVPARCRNRTDVETLVEPLSSVRT